MGSFLSQPVTDIEYGEEKSTNVTAVFGSMQGWRSSQEDAHLIKLNFDGQGSHIFGVFDGHGSELVSNYVADNFVSVLISTDAYKEKKYDLALEQAFMRFDELLEKESVIAELVLQQEKNSDGNKNSTDSLIDVLKSRYQNLIKEQEDDDEDEDAVNENDDNEKQNNGDKPSEANAVSASRQVSVGKDSVLSTSSTDGQAGDSTSVGNEENAITKADSSKDTNESASGVPSDENTQTEPDIDEEEDDLSAEDAMGDEEDEMATDMRAMMADAVYERKYSQLLKKIKDRELPGYGCGTTANVVLISGGKYYVANAGDSRSILCTKDEVIPLSSDHGPEVQTEKERIEKAGGQILDGRVNGGLNLSRAIGDLFYKRRSDLAPDEQLIISKPDVRIFDAKPTDRFLVLACDGIWNSLSNEATAKYFETENIDIKKQLKTLFSDVLADGSSPDGFGMDNMSVIYVHLNENNSNDDLAKFNEARQTADVAASKKRKLDDEDAPEETDQVEPPTKVVHQ